jgi:hypothetical protein
VSENSSTLDAGKDARQSVGAAAAAPAAGTVTTPPTTGAEGTPVPKPANQDFSNQPLPTNHVAPKRTKKQLKQEEDFRKKQVAAMQKAQAQAEAKKAIDGAAAKKQDTTKQQPNQ